MNESKHTEGPWYVGAQNDALYIVAGRKPSPDNDNPYHDAKRVAVAKVYASLEGDALPINERANAAVLAAAPELLKALRELLAAVKAHPDFNGREFVGLGIRVNDVIAKAEGRS